MQRDQRKCGELLPAWRNALTSITKIIAYAGTWVLSKHGPLSPQNTSISPKNGPCLLCNMSYLHEKESVPAYNAVFGMNFHLITSCTVDEVNEWKTVQDLLDKLVMDDG